jgi:hypothetical protein
MRQPKLTHEKYLAPIVAKQNSYITNKYMQSGASVFLPKIKIQILAGLFL